MPQSLFWTIFFVSWFVYAAFIGLAFSIPRTHDFAVTCFLITSFLIVTPIVVVFFDQHFFATPGAMDSTLSTCAFAGFAAALWSLRSLPLPRRGAAQWICRGALVACLCWGFLSYFFLPIIFLPDRMILPYHLLFALCFSGIAIASWFWFRRSWSAQAVSSSSPNHDRHNIRVDRPRTWMARCAKFIKTVILLYVFGMFITLVFGCPRVRTTAINSMVLPEPLTSFTEVRDSGLFSGKKHYSCSVSSFVPFLIRADYQWWINEPHKPESMRGLNGQATYIWAAGVFTKRINQSTRPLVFYTNGKRYEAIPK